MMKEELPEQTSQEVWNELDGIISYFLARNKTYITNDIHRAYLVQSLELLGFTLDECRQVNKYFSPIATKILSFFTDSNEKVKLAAIGAMYNLLTKYLEQGRQFFVQIFERLSVLIAQPTGQIRQAATFLNKALKTMVYDTVFDQTALNLKVFVQILAQRLQTGGNLAKQFMLDWLTTIEEVPQFQISNDLPLFFRQVFQLFLSSSKSLKTKAEDCLKKFLHVFKEILAVEGKLSTKLTQESTQILLEMMLLLVRQNLSSDITFHAMQWLQVFTNFFSQQLNRNFDPFLNPIYGFMLKDIILVVISAMSDQCQKVRRIGSRINQILLQVFQIMKVEKKNVQKASQLLEGLLAESKVCPRVQAVLKWIKLFFLKHNSQYLTKHIRRIMQLIIQKLCDRMATKSLYQLLEGSLFIDHYYDELVDTFLSYLCAHDKIPIQPIFKQILALKNPENHFLAICNKVQHQNSVVFKYHLIESLITVLVSSGSLQNLRMKISSKQGSLLFKDLFQKFMTNEPATLILSFLAGKYYLAKEFINVLAIEERLSSHNFRSLIRMSNLVEHSNMNHIRSDLRKSQSAVMAYLSLLMSLPSGKCSVLLLQRLPQQMPIFQEQTLNEQQVQFSELLISDYLKRQKGSKQI